MADPPRDPGYIVDVVPDRESSTSAPTSSARPRTPRWVTVSWSITLAVVVLFVIVLVIQGPHRPGMSGVHGLGGQPPATSAVAPGGGGHDPSGRGLG